MHFTALVKITGDFFTMKGWRNWWMMNSRKSNSNNIYPEDTPRVKCKEQKEKDLELHTDRKPVDSTGRYVSRIQ